MTKRRASEAVQRFSEAIQTEPDFALAYYLRGLAKKASNDFDGYKLDLTKAGELAPGSGYTAPLAGALRDEAITAHKKKDWATSMDLHGKLLATGEGDTADARKKLIDAAKGLYNEMRRSKNYDKWKEIDESLKGFKDEIEVQAALVKVLQDCAKDLATKGKSSDAKRCLRSAKKALKNLKDDKNYKRYKTDYDRSVDAVDKARKR